MSFCQAKPNAARRVIQRDHETRVAGPRPLPSTCANPAPVVELVHLTIRSFTKEALGMALSSSPISSGDR